MNDKELTMECLGNAESLPDKQRVHTDVLVTRFSQGYAVRPCLEAAHCGNTIACKTIGTKVAAKSLTQNATLMMIQ